MRRLRQRAICLLIMLGPLHPALATEISEDIFLAELPMVLTGSRLEQSLFDAPNALSVIDRRMIEASGFRDITELFRLVPGFQVVLMGGYLHSVNHGLSDEFARRMQVLVDGRSIYLPSFGGVRWDALPLAIDDIERIEVSRGPNAATYGANAFTGIINIITRHPQDVPPHEAVARVGQPEVGEFMYRRGGGNEDYQYRLTLEWKENEGFAGQNDFIEAPMLNYRGAYRLGEGRSFSLQFGYKGGERGLRDSSSPNRTENLESYYLQAGWQWALAEEDKLELQVSYSRTITDEYWSNPNRVIFASTLLPHSIDLESGRWDANLQYTVVHDSSLRSVWGMDLRNDAVKSLRYFSVSDELNNYSANVFGHVEWRPDSDWLLNAGAMLEKFDIGGGKVSPRLALHWQPHYSHAFRLGTSRAYRYPVLIEEQARWTRPFAGPLGSDFIWLGSVGNLKPEVVDSSELAYLGNWPSLGLSLDARLFRDEYRNLIDLVPLQATSLVPLIYAPNHFDNADSADLAGIDGQVRWQWSSHGQLLFNFAHTSSRSSDVLQAYSLATPKNQYGLLAMHRLPGPVDVSLGYYWTQGMKVIGGGPLKNSRRVDLRIAHPFKPMGKKAELALVLQGIANPYYEFDDNSYNRFDGRGYVSLKAEF